MIFAKINSDSTIIEKFPISENELRNIFKHTSLPNMFTNDNIPIDYVIILDKNEHELPSNSFESIKTETPVKNNSGKWTIPLSIEEISFTSIPNIDTFEVTLMLRIGELVEYTDNLVKVITASYKIPDAEMQTWGMQFSEALAWSKDINTKTPVLDMIAFSRGIDKNILKEKALQKAKDYQITISFIIGKKQYFEDLLHLAETVEDLNSIVFDISLAELQEVIAQFKQSQLSTSDSSPSIAEEFLLDGTLPSNKYPEDEEPSIPEEESVPDISTLSY